MRRPPEYSGGLFWCAKEQATASATAGSFGFAQDDTSCVGRTTEEGKRDCDYNGALKLGHLQAFAVAGSEEAMIAETMVAGVRRYVVGGLAVAVVVFAGCSKPVQAPVNTEAAAAAAGPPQLMTAKTAFWPMYKAAHIWSPDVQLIGIKMRDVPGFTNEGGKAAMWEATFGSPSQRRYEVDTNAIVTVLPDIHKGAAEGPERCRGAGRAAMRCRLIWRTLRWTPDAAYRAAAATRCCGVAEEESRDEGYGV